MYEIILEPLKKLFCSKLHTLCCYTLYVLQDLCNLGINRLELTIELNPLDSSSSIEWDKNIQCVSTRGAFDTGKGRLISEWYYTERHLTPSPFCIITYLVEGDRRRDAISSPAKNLAPLGETHCTYINFRFAQKIISLFR